MVATIRLLFTLVGRVIFFFLIVWACSKFIPADSILWVLVGIGFLAFCYELS